MARKKRIVTLRELEKYLHGDHKRNFTTAKSKLVNKNPKERISGFRDLIHNFLNKEQAFRLAKKLLENDKSPRVRQDSVYVLFYLDSSGRKSAELFKHALKDESPEVRIAGIHCLNWSSDSNQKKFIRKMLKDPNKKVRNVAKFVLGIDKLHKRKTKLE